MKTWEVTWWGKVVGHVRAPTSADARKLAFGWLGRTKLGIFAIGVKEERPTEGSCPKCGQWFAAHNGDGSCVLDELEGREEE